MNRYATTAMTYYRDYLPTRYAEIENPEEYFRDLGEQIQDQVTDLTSELSAPDQPGEGFLGKTGRLNAARNQAEELALHELLYSQKPENDPAMPQEIAEYYEGVNQTIQEIHDLPRQILDGTERNGR